MKINKMARKAPRKRLTDFDRFSKNYASVFHYGSFFETHKDEKGEVKGDLNELFGFWAKEMGREGASREDIKDAQEELTKRYLNNDKEVFLTPGRKGHREAVQAFTDYANTNLEGIIGSTDGQILREEVLPYIVENYSPKDGSYDGLHKLVQEEAELSKTKAKLENDKTRNDVIDGFVTEREAYYDQAYADNEFLREIFKNLISEAREINRFSHAYLAKRKELDKALDKDLKGYIQSAGLTGEDLVSIYEPLFNEAYVRASQSSDTS